MLIKCILCVFISVCHNFWPHFHAWPQYAVHSVLKLDKTIKKFEQFSCWSKKKRIMDKKRQRTIYLWSDPRSLSTAFLRAMMMADGCLVVSQLFRTLNINHYNKRLLFAQFYISSLLNFYWYIRLFTWVIVNIIISQFYITLNKIILWHYIYKICFMKSKFL